MTNTEVEPWDSLEERLQKIILDDGETLDVALRILKKKFEYSKKAVLTVDIITSPDSDFYKFIDIISEYFTGSKVIKCSSTGLQQYEEIENILLNNTGIVIVVDMATSAVIPFAGWLHSQDQGIKENRGDLKKISTEKNTHIILIRYSDAADKRQLLNAIAPNDFLDCQIKYTKIS